jgi:hypothetical protein
MQTIPDVILDRIAAERPHLQAMIDTLRQSTDLAQGVEKAIAFEYLEGTTTLSAMETWHLAQCANGAPWGGDWVSTARAAVLTGYDEAHIRRLAGDGKIAAMKRGKTWYVRRDGLTIKSPVEPSP